MAALDFPDSPSNGDEFSGYVYDSAKGVWNRLPTLPALDLVNFSAVAPSNPQDGQFWFDTTAGKMYVYYNDGSSAQWVSTLGGLVGQTGTDGQFLIHNGTEWVASNFTSPGSILQVVSTTKTNTFSASVASGANAAITDLSITHEVADSANKLLITGFTGVLSASGNQGDVGIAVYDGSSLLAVGDAAGSRTSITAGGRPSDSGSTLLGISPSFTFLHTPGAGSKTYSLRVINTSNSTQTIYVNQTERNDDAAFVRRGASALTIQEVAG